MNQQFRTIALDRIRRWEREPRQTFTQTTDESQQKNRQCPTHFDLCSVFRENFVRTLHIRRNPLFSMCDVTVKFFASRGK